MNPLEICPWAIVTLQNDVMMHEQTGAKKDKVPLLQ
jgi:hypothetical protein